MTWIVAGSGLIYPFIAGDVRVTFRLQDGSQAERDCLQKIHPVARNILGGFAGSVRGGFLLLHAIRQQLYDHHWYSLPKMTYQWLPRFMRRVFKALPPQEQLLGNQLIIVGAHPELTRGALRIPMCHTFRFSAPDFDPESTKGVECVGIGSGEAVERYRDAATKVSNEFWFHQTVRVGLKWPAHTMASTLHKIVSDDPFPGISPWFLYGSVSLAEFLIEAFEYTEYGPSGTTEHRLPPIARNYQEFVQYCGQVGVAAEAAVATGYATQHGVQPTAEVR